MNPNETTPAAMNLIICTYAIYLLDSVDLTVFDSRRRPDSDGCYRVCLAFYAGCSTSRIRMTKAEVLALVGALTEAVGTMKDDAPPKAEQEHAP